jgi:very-short-patch-repair endonuclease
VGPFIADFYYAEHRLVIEVNGSVHGNSDIRARDAECDGYLREYGVKGLRVPAKVVQEDLPAALNVIETAIDGTAVTASIRT